MNNMILNSIAFKRNGYLPAKYSCDGLNVNPPLKITEIPTNASSLVLIFNDPDTDTGQWTHWLLWNISPTTKIIEENNIPEEAIVGQNDFGNKKYEGPCPPNGTHHYIFELYALDNKLNLPDGADKNMVKEAMIGHIITQTELTGLYSR
ncbi:MAG: YbhB/YbcL family Raf kinase inhibitor-like protein [Candidatus Magasanikbacteria bacterium CG10_big_fil_rev_8_21_14_0_10_36_32]|uniref:YbhB/YbcL family Raf kinase inhibitor-like protein n=1 Tax=Candidatus Magasanikbacteria bacterium CG10_big_fil_rev_8_21_14_0_10_36_32 TaxID=1974646 RepID=A0A2M6W7E0_9BACT|nr:MAG: YbhB/YbcL family Raf kinase inhibitor-like protein [Candidatus Magasanikbacteria bacterium CG10_big_fil_rev_8_21_14_0_10_36_32]